MLIVNTCAFIEAAREESVDTILELVEVRQPGAKLIVTGCMAQRYGDELAAALPEVDVVSAAGIGEEILAAAPSMPAAGDRAPKERAGVERDGSGNERGSGSPPISVRVTEGAHRASTALLDLDRPRPGHSWAYLKVAEGCDRRCGFCAIPLFKGAQVSRSVELIMRELDGLGDGVREVVLVAQDLASYGMDAGSRHRRWQEQPARRTSAVGTASEAPAGDGAILSRSAFRGDAGGRTPLVDLVEKCAQRIERVRLLYLYPSAVSDVLVDTVCSTGVPYFDLSLQHASRGLLRKMKRWGGAERFLELIGRIREREPEAVLRSSFVIGYPGETEADHAELLSFLEEAQLEWAGFFRFSEEEGTYAAGLPGKVPFELAMERLRECSELQDAVTVYRRTRQIGRVLSVLVDRPGEARSYMEAPEIDGIIRVPRHLPAGSLVTVRVVSAVGVDLEALEVAAAMKLQHG